MKKCYMLKCKGYTYQIPYLLEILSGKRADGTFKPSTLKEWLKEQEEIIKLNLKK